SAMGFFIALVLFRKQAATQGLEQTFNSRLGGVLSFFALSIVGWTVLTFVFFATPKEGVSASMVPAIASLQQSVLKIGQDVSEVKGSVGRIEEKIDQLLQGGVVVSNPKTPEEFYANARLYEVKGNTGEAIKSYEKFLELAPDYIDAHQAYQTLLNTTQGVEVTRARYAELLAKYPDNAVVKLAALRVSPDRDQRLSQLLALAAKHPRVGPIHYELAQEYLRAGPGNVTIEEMKAGKEAFERFKQADEKGTVKPYYVDKKELAAVYKKKEEYDKMVTAFYGWMMEKPVDFKVTLLPNSLVDVTIIPKEVRIKKIFYSIDDPNPTIDTGVSQVKDPMTGELTPNIQVTGKLGLGKHVLYAKYVNSQGQESPVYSFPFEATPISATVDGMPGDLGSSAKNYLVSFQSNDGKDYEIFYGIDKEPDVKSPDMQLNLQGITAGPHQLSYYGLSGGQKTDVYRIQISQ
ncbi:MAG TPA: tetratricopeptide repeat protein, partial [bacterium]|nr:tetratricopeptide repeat protein [bacterium]